MRKFIINEHIEDVEISDCNKLTGLNGIWLRQLLRSIDCCGCPIRKQCDEHSGKTMPGMYTPAETCLTLWLEYNRQMFGGDDNSFISDGEI